MKGLPIHVAAESRNLPGNNNILISDWLVGGIKRITRDSYELGRELNSVFPRDSSINCIYNGIRYLFSAWETQGEACELVEMRVSRWDLSPAKRIFIEVLFLHIQQNLFWNKHNCESFSSSVSC